MSQAANGDSFTCQRGDVSWQTGCIEQPDHEAALAGLGGAFTCASVGADRAAVVARRTAARLGPAGG